MQHNDYTVGEGAGGRNHRSVPNWCLYTIPEVSTNCHRDASKSNDKDEEAGPQMTARIFKPAKNAMQSGRSKTREWQLDYEPE